jgi:isopentenyl phosphate kinase
MSEQERTDEQAEREETIKDMDVSEKEAEDVTGGAAQKKDEEGEFSWGKK